MPRKYWSGWNRLEGRQHFRQAFLKAAVVEVVQDYRAFCATP